MGEKATGRIIRSISGFYDVQLPDQVVTCRARGILRKEGSSPLTGDVVNISLEKGKGMVESILPRRNSFVRPAVANVDALVVFAANVNPITEPFLIDRVAAIAGDQGVEVYLCVNKCDLDPGAELVRIYSHAGFPVISTSAETGDGVEQLLKGKLTAFTGNSGVGKSSILNRLCPELTLPTGEVSEKLGRGRHTTRHVELFSLGQDTYVVDTPGFSSFDTDELGLALKERLPETFLDFAPYLDGCRFVGCSHTKEKGCAVLQVQNAACSRQNPLCDEVDKQKCFPILFPGIPEQKQQNALDEERRHERCKKLQQIAGDGRGNGDSGAFCIICPVNGHT